MSVELHLLGGSGRIGQALINSLLSRPLPGLDSIKVYCDSTRVPDLSRLYPEATDPAVTATSYSAFNTSLFAGSEDSSAPRKIRNIVINLRGANNKQCWLNQPLNSLDLHINSCRTLIDANFWMQPGTELIHLSSQLCDLIEGSRCLDEICEGQESYRRPYMVSRLHQEMMLSANAYQHSIVTLFLRLPAVYGFEDDRNSPWVLNSLCKQKREGVPVQARHPDRMVYLTHRDHLVDYLRFLMTSPSKELKARTVSYTRPPMLELTVKSLASLVRYFPSDPSLSEIRSLDIRLTGDSSCLSSDIGSHIRLLMTSIGDLLSHA